MNFIILLKFIYNFYNIKYKYIFVNFKYYAKKMGFFIYNNIYNI